MTSDEWNQPFKRTSQTAMYYYRSNWIRCGRSGHEQKKHRIKSSTKIKCKILCAEKNERQRANVSWDVCLVNPGCVHIFMNGYIKIYSQTGARKIAHNELNWIELIENREQQQQQQKKRATRKEVLCFVKIASVAPAAAAVSMSDHHDDISLSLLPRIHSTILANQKRMKKHHEKSKVKKNTCALA